MANRDERNEYATAKWDAEEVRRQAASEQHRRSSESCMLVIRARKSMSLFSL